MFSKEWLEAAFSFSTEMVEKALKGEWNREDETIIVVNERMNYLDHGRHEMQMIKCIEFLEENRDILKISKIEKLAGLPDNSLTRSSLKRQGLTWDNSRKLYKELCNISDRFKDYAEFKEVEDFRKLRITEKEHRHSISNRDVWVDDVNKLKKRVKGVRPLRMKKKTEENLKFLLEQRKKRESKK